MAQTRRDDGECPYLRPARPAGGDVLVGLYCGLPGGRARVPSADERRLFCLPSNFLICPVYQRYAPAS